jgi:hypothetical protein
LQPTGRIGNLRANRLVVPYLQLVVVTEFRRQIARLLALCVFVLTFGQVQVNSTGRSTTDGPGRADTHVSAKQELCAPPRARRAD